MAQTVHLVRWENLDQRSVNGLRVLVKLVWLQDLITLAITCNSCAITFFP